MVPNKIFFVRGVGVNKDRLGSFEAALRSAGIEQYNLVYVSSIFPPFCKQVKPSVGLKLLSPGQIEQAWDERKQIYRANQHIVKTSSICQSAQGNKEGLWTTTVACAVIIIDKS